MTEIIFLNDCKNPATTLHQRDHDDIGLLPVSATARWKEKTDTRQPQCEMAHRDAQLDKFVNHNIDRQTATAKPIHTPPKQHETASPL